MAKKNNNTYQQMSDKQIINEFYSIPMTRLIFNVIILATFVTGFIIVGASQNDNAIWIALGLFALGAVLSATCRMGFSSENQALLADEMTRRYRDGKSHNRYYWLFKKEQELTGTIKQTGSAKVISIISVVLTVVNYLFSLLSALILMAFAAAFLVLAAFGYFLYIMGRAMGGNVLAELGLNLAELGKWPLKIAFKFAKLVLKLDIKSQDFTEVINDLQNAGSTSGTKAPVSETVAELRVYEYISLDHLVLRHCHWESVPNLTVRGNDIEVRGTLVCDPLVHKSDVDVNKTISDVTAEIESMLSKQLEKYFQDYPMAKKATYDIEIKGYIG